MEKLEGELSFPRENFHFPRSDGCLTERSEVRQSRSRKRKVLSRKRKSLRVFSSQSTTSFQPQGCIFSSSSSLTNHKKMFFMDALCPERFLWMPPFIELYACI